MKQELDSIEADLTGRGEWWAADTRKLLSSLREALEAMQRTVYQLCAVCSLKSGLWGENCDGCAVQHLPGLLRTAGYLEEKP